MLLIQPLQIHHVYHLTWRVQENKEAEREAWQPELSLNPRSRWLTSAGVAFATVNCSRVKLQTWNPGWRRGTRKDKLRRQLFIHQDCCGRGNSAVKSSSEASSVQWQRGLVSFINSCNCCLCKQTLGYSRGVGIIWQISYFISVMLVHTVIQLYTVERVPIPDIGIGPKLALFSCISAHLRMLMPATDTQGKKNCWVVLLTRDGAILPRHVLFRQTWTAPVLKTKSVWKFCEVNTDDPARGKLCKQEVPRGSMKRKSFNTSDLRKLPKGGTRQWALKAEAAMVERKYLRLYSKLFQKWEHSKM